MPPQPDAPEVLVLVAHPQIEHSRANRALMRAAGEVAAASKGRVEVRDLYALYPDYLIDASAEQALLAGAKLVVWQHPVHWYSMPPLMKLWIDEVLAFGWAYGPGGDALRGRDLWLVTSTGGPESSYRYDGANRLPFENYLAPCEQTALLTGLRWLPPMVLHGAHRVDDAALNAHVEVFAERLRSYPAWPEIAGLDPCPACEVPADERPAAAA